MKKKIIIIGGKGTALNIAEAIIDADIRFNAPVEFIGFAFDDESMGDTISGYPVLCKTKEVYSKYGHIDDVAFIFQMHHQLKMEERAELIASYNIPDNKWFTFIHPSAFVSRSVKLGFGTVVYVNCAIHSNTIIGNHCTFCALTTIGHDSIIGNNVFTATHVCIGSSVQIKDCNFLGQNSTITSAMKIEANNLIGLGAVIIKNIEESNGIYVGSPARFLKKLK